MAGGWIALWREIEEHPVWATAEQRLVVLTLLMSAAWKERRVMVGGKEITLKPGQLLGSRRELAEKALVSEQQFRTSLAHLENLGFSTSQSTSRGTLITIVNWGKWQGGGDEANQPINQPSTSHQPAINQPIQEQFNQETKKENTGTHAPARDAQINKRKPQDAAEVEAYFNERAYNFDHHEQAERFWDFYESKGWRVGRDPMKDWKAAARNWAKNAVKEYRDAGWHSAPRTGYRDARRRSGGDSVQDIINSFEQENERRKNDGNTGGFDGFGFGV